MLLKKLQLQGYKTFASRTEFVFDSGVTAIVGPNGSGKSNIADAIRWVLGEQRQSSLRIKRTEDLIFAGSRLRPRQGMAEVAITLDNSTHWLPVDFDEVYIVRRVYRSGESEYLLNGARIRAREIIEMLEKGGLSRDSYVVIGQGLVDAALSLRPIERRSLFEVAAGIRLYQAKKDEALSKLEDTRLNLVRISDIIAEITPRLASLQVQAQRAEEHQVLSRDLDELLRLWYGFHWQQGWTRLQEIEAQQAEITEFIAHQRANIAAATQRLARIGAAQAALRERLSAWHQESSALHRQIDEKDRALAVVKERHRLLLPQEQQTLEEIAELQCQRQAQEERVRETTASAQSISAEQQQAEVALAALRTRWEEAKRQRDTLNRVWQQTREAIYGAAAAASDAENRRAALAERHSELRALVARQREAIVAQERILAELQDQLAHHQQQELAREAQIRTAEEELRRLRDEVTAQQEQKLALQREGQRRAQEIAALRHRQQIVARMRDELSGYYPGVRAVLQAAERGDLRGVHGPVVRLVQIRAELDAAIEVALGAHLQDVVVETWQDAEAAIALLKRANGGRATFLPLDTIRAGRAGSAPRGEGVLGMANQLVQFDPRYATIFDHLLGQTVIVTNLKVAHRLLGELRGNLRIVTLEGELVLASGAVSGGSRQATDGKIALEREWQEIPDALAALQNVEAVLVAQQRELDGNLRQSEQAIAAADAELRALRIEQERQRRAGARLAQEAQHARDEIVYQQSTMQRAESELATFDQRRDELTQKERAARDNQAALASRLAELEQQMAALDSDTLRQEISAAQTALALAVRNHESTIRELQEQRDALQRLAGQTEIKARRLAELRNEIAAAARQMTRLGEETDALRVRVDELRREIEPAEDEVKRLDADERVAREAADQAHEKLRELEMREQELVLRRKSAQEELDRLQRQIEDDLGPISLPHRYPLQLSFTLDRQERQLVEVSVLPESLETDIRELRARIRRLGGFNPNAPAEYRDTLERHTFLSTQAADLEKAIQSLQQVIAELDEVMEREFRQTFRAVAEAFSEYFALLFGGGSARLVLTEPDALNETGVEIIARPPGKRQQSLALLSGGERALTAAALLFAILKTRPLPFCVLDEVDAMLDEANVGRFRDALVAMARDTQFIVITHNRHTISAANTIYGISMRQDGVSTALSLRLDEAERKIAAEPADTR